MNISKKEQIQFSRWTLSSKQPTNYLLEYSYTNDNAEFNIVLQYTNNLLSPQRSIKRYLEHLGLLCSFSEVRVARFLVFCLLFWGQLFVLFSFFRLAIVLSVFQFTDSDYPFGTFKLLFNYIHRMSPEKKGKKGAELNILNGIFIVGLFGDLFHQEIRFIVSLSLQVSLTFLYFIYFTITPTNVSTVVETVHFVSICHIMTYILGNR